MAGRGAAVERNVAALVLFAVFRGFTVGGYQTLFSTYMRVSGYSMTGIGVVVTASSIVSVLTAPGFGGVIEYYGARIATMATGLALLTSLALLAAPSPPYTVFIASYTLYMLNFILGQPARFTLLARSIPLESYGYYAGLTVTAFALARVLGSTVSGWVVTVTSYPTLFSLLAVLMAIGLLLFYTLSIEVVEKPGRPGLASVVIGAYKRAFKLSPSMRRLYPLLVVDRCGWTLWTPLLGAYLKDLGFDEWEIGVLYSIQALVQALSSTPWGRVVDSIGSIKTIVLTEALGVAAAVILANPASWPVAAAGMTVYGLALGSWAPAYNKLVAQLAGDRLGEAYANANAVRSLAEIPMPSIGGYLYHTLNPLAPHLLSALLLGFSAVYAYRLVKVNMQD